MGQDATPRRGEGPKTSARAFRKAALCPDLKIRFGHDLDPFRSTAPPPLVVLPTAGAAICARALPRHSGVLNMSLGFDRPSAECAWFAKTLARTGVARITPAKPVPKIVSKGDQILGERAGGPNAAHRVTQTVSNPYLRVETGDGKHIAEKTHKVWGGNRALSSR